MTKLETVQALHDCGPQLQIVESVRALQQTVRSMHEDLSRLPSAIASETAQTLEPLARLRQDVTQALEAYDKVTAIQRQALDELTQRMSTSAAQAFEQRAMYLSATISELKTSLASVERTAQQVAALPGRLASAQQSMTKAADQLTEAANGVRPRLWRQALALVLAGAVGAMLVATGQVVLDRLVPPGDVHAKAAMWDTLWSKASPREREVLKQIVNRPAK